jgi:hypothetical protein
MIYFIADDHYESFPGRKIYESLPEELRKNITFCENDWSILEAGELPDDCELLILNMIGTTCNLPHPDANAEKAVRSWCEKGGNFLLLHGSSAAFWQWNWWREIVGYRWVRPGDPDQVPTSTHPKQPYSLRVLKTRHPLIGKLQAFDLPEDEVYTGLEQTQPALFLMTTFIEGESFPQCTLSFTPQGGKVINFIPGHKEECVTHPVLCQNIDVLMRYLLK